MLMIVPPGNRSGNPQVELGSLVASHCCNPVGGQAPGTRLLPSLCRHGDSTATVQRLLAEGRDLCEANGDVDDCAGVELRMKELQSIAA